MFAANGPPTAVDDREVTNVNTPVVVSVLANDSDPDGDALSVSSFTQPSNGAASLNAAGAFRYTPNSGFTGVDSFTYTITDGHGGTSTATVTLTIQPGVCLCTFVLQFQNQCFSC